MVILPQCCIAAVVAGFARPVLEAVGRISCDAALAVFINTMPVHASVVVAACVASTPEAAGLTTCDVGHEVSEALHTCQHIMTNHEKIHASKDHYSHDMNNMKAHRCPQSWPPQST